MVEEQQRERQRARNGIAPLVNDPLNSCGPGEPMLISHNPNVTAIDLATCSVFGSGGTRVVTSGTTAPRVSGPASAAWYASSSSQAG